MTEGGVFDEFAGTSRNPTADGLLEYDLFDSIVPNLYWSDESWIGFQEMPEGINPGSGFSPDGSRILIGGIKEH